jgi:hypothetical protein
LKFDRSSIEFPLDILYSQGIPSVKELSFRECVDSVFAYWPNEDTVVRRWRFTIFDGSCTTASIPFRAYTKLSSTIPNVQRRTCTMKSASSFPTKFLCI